jgi:glycolate oxidase iron-sulfur subunit
MTTAAERKVIQKKFQEHYDPSSKNYDDLLNCMRCGFCLPSCPTYVQSGFKETHSPRGRIALIKGVVDGLITPDKDVEDTLQHCLGCRACETVCPSGVKYGFLLEQARDIINQNKKFSLPVRVLRKAVFEQLFVKPKVMSNVIGLVGIYQRTGLKKVVHGLGIMSLFPSTLKHIDNVLPPAPTFKQLKNRPTHVMPIGTPKKRVAFFKGCLMDTVFMETNNSTIKLLKLAGCEIVIPETQACCGALHGHAGEKEGSKDLAKRNIKAFEDLNVDYIISNAGGCGAFLVDYAHLLHGDAEYADRAQAFVDKIMDITKILVQLDFHQLDLRLPEGQEQIITYQDSCHLKNVMKTWVEPRTLLKAIKGATYIEMNEADRCCGSAGVYNIVEAEMSMKYLDYKMVQVRKTDAKTVVTANPGCLLQMKLGIEKEGLSKNMRGVHIVDLLVEASEHLMETGNIVTK